MEAKEEPLSKASVQGFWGLPKFVVLFALGFLGFVVLPGLNVFLFWAYLPGSFDFLWPKRRRLVSVDGLQQGAQWTSSSGSTAIREKFPQPLNCTAADIPEGWSMDPIPLNQLEDFCDEPPCIIPPQSKSTQQKKAILNPVRLKRIKAELDTLDPSDGTIVLTLLNFGYAFLFVNFVCGCETRGIKIRDSMLVVSIDREGYDLARKMGFAVVSSDYITKGTKWTIDSSAPETFTSGDYFWLAGMMNVFLADIQSFGYNVLLQDADVTWRHDPRPYLNRPEAAEFDVQAMSDGASTNGRHDKTFNGGFLWYRNNCKAKKWLETLRSLVDWILWMNSDQQAVNRLLTDSHFKGLKSHQLDKDLFINGNRWQPWRINPKRPVPLSGMVWHASWTHNHYLKMTKLLVVGEWHISTCRWYNESIIPKFNFTKELEGYGKDEYGHTEEILKELIQPHWVVKK